MPANIRLMETCADRARACGSALEELDYGKCSFAHPLSALELNRYHGSCNEATFSFVFIDHF